MRLRVVGAGLEQIPSLHSGMRPTFDAVGEGKCFWVSDSNPEAVTAFLSNSCQGAKLPMLYSWFAIVLIEQV